jgi:hypothetical protein
MAITNAVRTGVGIHLIKSANALMIGSNAAAGMVISRGELAQSLPGGRGLGLPRRLPHHTAAEPLRGGGDPRLGQQDVGPRYGAAGSAATT